MFSSREESVSVTCHLPSSGLLLLSLSGGPLWLNHASLIFILHFDLLHGGHSKDSLDKGVVRRDTKVT